MCALLGHFITPLMQFLLWWTLVISISTYQPGLVLIDFITHSISLLPLVLRHFYRYSSAVITAPQSPSVRISIYRPTFISVCSCCHSIWGFSASLYTSLLWKKLLNSHNCSLPWIGDAQFHSTLQSTLWFSSTRIGFPSPLSILPWLVIHSSIILCNGYAGFVCWSARTDTVLVRQVFLTLHWCSLVQIGSPQCHCTLHMATLGTALLLWTLHWYKTLSSITITTP